MWKKIFAPSDISSVFLIYIKFFFLNLIYHQRKYKYWTEIAWVNAKKSFEMIIQLV